MPPGAVSITTNVSSNQFVENSVISFTCSSSGGKPPPAYRWLRNGQPLNSAIYTPPPTGTEHHLGTSSSQIVVHLQRSDHSANYTCEVYNQANQNAPVRETRMISVQCKY